MMMMTLIASSNVVGVGVAAVVAILSATTKFSHYHLPHHYWLP
jgi:hypothetical protein